MCVPYYTIDCGLDYTLTLVDRKLYPENEFPYGQWEYMRFYEDNFAEATDPMNANVHKFLKLAFRKGDPVGEGQARVTSMARKGRGLFGSAEIPDVPVTAMSSAMRTLAFMCRHWSATDFSVPVPGT